MSELFPFGKIDCYELFQLDEKKFKEEINKLEKDDLMTCLIYAYVEFEILGGEEKERGYFEK